MKGYAFFIKQCKEDGSFLETLQFESFSHKTQYPAEICSKLSFPATAVTLVAGKSRKKAGRMHTQ